MSSNYESLPRSAGRRGFDVRFATEDFYYLDEIFGTADNLRDADSVSINFDPYRVPAINTFGVFREFTSAEAFVEFRGMNGSLSEIMLNISDPADRLRSVFITASHDDGTTYTMQNIHNNMIQADEAHIRDILLHILLEQNDTHGEDLTFNGIYEYFKLLHPARTETRKYTQGTGYLLDAYVNPEDIDFAVGNGLVEVTTEKWFDGTRQVVEKPLKTDIRITTDTSLPVMDSNMYGQGNLHMLLATRIFQAMKDAEGVYTFQTATCSTELLQEPNRVYGRNENVLSANLETILAENDAHSSYEFLERMGAAMQLFAR